jgi:hypothetical protein
VALKIPPLMRVDRLVAAPVSCAPINAGTLPQQFGRI